MDVPDHNMTEAGGEDIPHPVKMKALSDGKESGNIH